MDGMSGNQALRNDERIKDTFMNGGYYRYDVNEKVAVLVLDSMYYMTGNDQSLEGDVPQTQFGWLEA